MKVLYHAVHSCGHAVYWSESEAPFFASLLPCPWDYDRTTTGGILHLENGITVRTEANAYCDHEQEGEETEVRHMPNMMCCNIGFDIECGALPLERTESQ